MAQPKSRIATTSSLELVQLSSSTNGLQSEEYGLTNQLRRRPQGKLKNVQPRSEAQGIV